MEALGCKSEIVAIHYEAMNDRVFRSVVKENNEIAQTLIHRVTFNPNCYNGQEEVC